MRTQCLLLKDTNDVSSTSHLLGLVYSSSRLPAQEGVWSPPLAAMDVQGLTKKRRFAVQPREPSRAHSGEGAAARKWSQGPGAGTRRLSISSSLPPTQVPPWLSAVAVPELLGPVGPLSYLLRLNHAPQLFSLQSLLPCTHFLFPQIQVVPSVYTLDAGGGTPPKPVPTSVLTAPTQGQLLQGTCYRGCPQSA